MVMIRPGFSDILAPGLKKVISLSFNRYPDQYSKIFNVMSSNKQTEKTSQLEGAGIAQSKDEGDSINYVDLTQGYDESFTHTTFALGLRISREMYDDDLYGQMKKGATFLGRSIKQAMEVTGANIFNNGFTDAAAYHGGDSKPLFSASHPFARGGTGSNTPAAAADLSQTTLEAALTSFEDTTDSDGLTIQVIPKTLLVPTALRWTASVLLESQLKSGVANNDKNPLLDLDLNYMVNNYLTDSDSWYILGDQNELMYYVRQAPKFGNDDDFDTGDAKFKVVSRFSAGWADWKGVYGVQGA